MTPQSTKQEVTLLTSSTYTNLISCECLKRMYTQVFGDHNNLMSTLHFFCKVRALHWLASMYTSNTFSLVS